MSRIDKAIELAARGKTDAPPQGTELSAQTRSSEGHSLADAGFGRLEPRQIDHPMLVSVTDPNSYAAEQYKKLRALVLRKTRGEPFRNTLLVTSAVPGEGKTLTTLNLAISLARTPDCSVVLVDTDLRNPQLHRLLGVKTEFGLVDYLRGKVRLEETLVKVGLGTLTLIPAGEKVDDPLELLTSKRMRQLIEELGARYHDRYVVLDTPPILPFADLRVLGEMVDGILYVCREGYSAMGQIAQGLEALSDYALLGIVCNDIHITTQPDYGQYLGYR